jgi:hypothetical protein
MGTIRTSVGPNTEVISYSQNLPLSDLITAIEGAILNSHGWELFDAEADVNARCYRALNKDNTTYKYVVLNYNTSGKLLMDVYESWNASTHVGTNKCNVLTGNVWNSVNLTLTDKGFMYVYASPRWLAFTNKEYSSSVLGNSTITHVMGCFEIARDNPDDTVVAGYPCFCILNTTALGDGYSNSAGALFPRTLAGTTAVQQQLEVSTIFGKTNCTSTVPLSSIIPNFVNIWNNKDWAVTMYAHGPNFDVRGRIFGLKAFTLGKLSFMDKLKVTADSDFHFDPNGTLTDHFVLPGGVEQGTYGNARFLIPA